MKATLKQIPPLVSSKQIFEGNSIFSKIIDKLYIIYSYGEHFPLAIYNFDTNKWYQNTDKYSTTTSKHQSIINIAIANSKARPYLCNLAEIKNFIKYL